MVGAAFVSRAAPATPDGDPLGLEAGMDSPGQSLCKGDLRQQPDQDGTFGGCEASALLLLESGCDRRAPAHGGGPGASEMNGPRARVAGVGPALDQTFALERIDQAHDAA